MALNPKLYYIHKFSTFATFTDDENKLSKDAGKCDKDAKQKLEESLSVLTLKRSIRKSALIKKDGAYNEKFIIGISENEVLRWIIKNNPSNVKTIVGNKKLIEGIVFLKVCHNDILQSIIRNGLLIDGQEYRFFTAGAGQQRKNEITLLEKSILNEFKSWYACGLTDEVINERNGMNMGKYLSYCALPLSSSCPIMVDVDRIVVVPDLELTIDKPVEYVDIKTFESCITTLKTLNKKINQTDGCGMVLPSMLREFKQQLGLDYSISGVQIRAPWIKGLLVPFDFRQFCSIKGNSIVRDIYEVDHDILAEDIQIILTASQFKAWTIYTSWDEYKLHFKANGLNFSATNVSNPPKEICEVSYQYLQTLDRDKASPKAISALCEKSVQHLKALRHDKNEVLKVFGAVVENKNLEPLQEALLIYPPLLRDDAIRHNVEKKINKCKKVYKGGHLLTEGFYGYAMPDLYGFCEFLFQGNDNPAGLIPSDSVYCQYYRGRDIKEVDCLRSPHFRSSDHAVRKLDQSANCEEWFKYCGQNAVCSLRDYLMLAVQGDFDGDTLLITPEKSILDLVKPNTVLSYDMAKAPAQEISMESICQTLVSSFACNDIQEGNTVGLISNAITKIWNADEITFEDAELIKCLVILNNYVIDYPKTQKSIELPSAIQTHYSQLDRVKSPYFFQWAKGKKSTELRNNSIMGQVVKYLDEVPEPDYTYFASEESFDYSMLQRRSEDGKIIGIDRCSDEYKNIHTACMRLGSQIQRLVIKEIKSDRKRRHDEIELYYNLQYAICLEELLSICPDMVQLANILIDLHYNQEAKIVNMSNLIWNCVGDVVVESIGINQKQADYVQRQHQRKAYQKRKEYIHNLVNCAQTSIADRRANIYRHDVDTTLTIEKPEERKIYFALLCLCKSNAAHTVTLVSKARCFNKAKLAKIAGLHYKTANEDSVQVILDSLQRQELIDFFTTRKKGKGIKINNYKYDETGEVIITLNYRVDPYVYYSHLFEQKKIKQCEICGSDFVAVKNKRTCSDKCRKSLNIITKYRLNHKDKELELLQTLGA